MLTFFQTDSKSSPLAMLAKTCSQIGADSNLAPNTKSSQGVLRSSEKLDVGQESRYIPSISPLLHSSKSEDDVGANRSRSSSTEIRVSDSKGIPVSKQSPIPRALSSASSSLSPASNFTSRRGSASPQSQVEIGRKSKSPKSKDATIKETPTSPTMKPTSDIFGASRDHQLRNLGIPDGHSPSRPMFSGASFPPNLFSAASTNPFLASFLASSMATAVTSTSSATTVTSSSSSQCRDPLCRDPSCATFIRNHQLLAAASGGLPSLGAYSSLIQREAILSAQRNAVMAAAAASASPGSAGGPLPFVCNWMGGKIFINMYTPRDGESTIDFWSMLWWTHFQAFRSIKVV